MLIWKIHRQPKPFGNKHIGFLGSIPVALVEDLNERDPIRDQNFRLQFSLPPKCWRGSQDDLFLTGYGSYFFKLDKAKIAAERIVLKWINDARLSPDRNQI